MVRPNKERSRVGSYRSCLVVWESRSAEYNRPAEELRFQVVCPRAVAADSPGCSGPEAKHDEQTSRIGEEVTHVQELGVAAQLSPHGRPLGEVCGPDMCQDSRPFLRR